MSEKWKNKLRIKSNNIRIFLAELTGTFLLIVSHSASCNTKIANDLINSFDYRTEI